MNLARFSRLLAALLFLLLAPDASPQTNKHAGIANGVKPDRYQQRWAEAMVLGEVFRSEWIRDEGKYGFETKATLYRNGLVRETWSSTGLRRGSKGGSADISTNDVASVLALLGRLPPSAQSVPDGQGISFAWGATTNRQNRIYDRANPSAELLEICRLSKSRFEQVVAPLKVKTEFELAGGGTVVKVLGPETILVSQETLSLWNWKTRSEIYRVKETMSENSGARALFDRLVVSHPSTNGRIAYACDEMVVLRDAATGRELWRHSEPHVWNEVGFVSGLCPRGIYLTPDAGAILVAAYNELRRYTPATGTNFTVVCKFATNAAQVIFSDDGQFIAVGGHPPEILEIYAQQKADGPEVVSARINELTQVRLMKPDGTILARFPQPNAEYSLAFSHDNKRLAALDKFSWEIRIYDTTTMVLEHVMPVWVKDCRSGTFMSSLFWSPDGRFLAVTGDGRPVVVCDMKRRQPVATSSGGFGAGVSFTPDRSAIIAQSGGGQVCVFDLSELRK